MWHCLSVAMVNYLLKVLHCYEQHTHFSVVHAPIIGIFKLHSKDHFVKAFDTAYDKAEGKQFAVE